MSKTPVFYRTIGLKNGDASPALLMTLCKRAQAMGYELMPFAGWNPMTDKHNSPRVSANRDRLFEILGDDACTVAFDHYAPERGRPLDDDEGLAIIRGLTE